MLRAEDRAAVIHHDRHAVLVVRGRNGEDFDPVLRTVGHRLGQRQEMTVGVLFHGADLFDVGHEGPAASVEDRDLGALHFDEGIVNAAPMKGGEVLGGVDAGVALFEGRPAPGLHDEVAVCGNQGLAVEVHPLEHVPVVRIGRLDGQLGHLSGVEANAFEREAAERVCWRSLRTAWLIAPEGRSRTWFRRSVFEFANDPAQDHLRFLVLLDGARRVSLQDLVGLEDARGDAALGGHLGSIGDADVTIDAHLPTDHAQRAPMVVDPAIPVWAAMTVCLPMLTLWATWMRLSSLTPSPRTVDPSVARSMVVPAPISHPSPMTTLPSWGTFSYRPSAGAKPNPSAPMMAPACRMHSAPMTHPWPTMTRGPIRAPSPMVAFQPHDGPGLEHDVVPDGRALVNVAEGSDAGAFADVGVRVHDGAGGHAILPLKMGKRPA